MKILVFVMNAAEVEPIASDIISTLQAGTYECIRINYWLDDYLPKAALLSREAPLLTLVDGGFQQAPRVTADEYVSAKGGVQDFFDITLHDHAVHGWPRTEERLNNESIYYQRYRGIALKARALIRAMSPDVVFVPHGAEGISRIVAAEAASLGVSVLVWESSFFPGFLNLESGPQHFVPAGSGLYRRLQKTMAKPLSAAANSAAAEFLELWTQRKASKYTQSTSSAERAAVDAFLCGSTKPVVFLPTQLAWDASVLFGLQGNTDLSQLFASAIEQLGQDYRFIVKIHPKDYTDEMDRLARIPGIFIAHNTSIHDILDRSDIVLVHSSNVGLESLMRGMPVVVMGSPIYAGWGLTSDLSQHSELAAAVSGAQAPDVGQLLRLLHTIVFDHLIRTGDVHGVEARIADTRIRGAEAGNSLQKFAPFYGPCAEEFLHDAREYSSFAKKNYSFGEICRSIPSLASLHLDCPDRTRLRSGERQVGCDYSDVEPGHVARYALAVAMLKPGLNILDIACGIGYGTHLLAERADSVVGVDCSAEAVNSAQAHWAHPGVQYECASAGSWFETQRHQYDAIVSFESLEHMNDARSFLTAAWGALRDGGVLFLSCPNAEHYPLTDNPFHVVHLTADELGAMLTYLPDVEDYVIWHQNGSVIGPDVRHGRFLVAVVRKAGANAPLSSPLSPRQKFELKELPIRKVFRIGADSFFAGIGQKAEDCIRHTTCGTSGHMVYGPYVRLGPGKYRVQFSLQACVMGVPGEGSLTIDVVNAHDHQLSRRTLLGSQIIDAHAQRMSLEFTNETPDLPLEFRVHVDRVPINGELMFFGVTVHRVDQDSQQTVATASS